MGPVDWMISRILFYIPESAIIHACGLDLCPGKTDIKSMDDLKEVLAADREVRLVETDIYSVLSEAAGRHDYDRKANIYDFVVSTRWYNAVMWGSSPNQYRSFARQALESGQNGLVLDAACGSLLFTAPVYFECQRKIIAFDQSIAMLQRARRRLIEVCGRVPEHVRLLQADVSDLPFRPGCFQTVLCMNVLHHVEDATALLPNLKVMVADGGRLYLTSLVTNNRLIGDWYLNALHKSGEIVRPRSKSEVQELLEGSLNQEICYRVNGNMAFAST
jgi:ubiquinone/menaquinone biosynthesis C-methylase UbiE